MTHSVLSGMLSLYAITVCVVYGYTEVSSLHGINMAY